MRCKATSKRSGERCKKDAMIGREVCHIHGGKTPKGMDSPHWKTGRYSTDLPSRLLERYGASINDPELLNQEAEIALIDARIADILQRVDTGESGNIYKKMRQQYDIFVNARQTASRLGDDQSSERARQNAIAAEAVNEWGRLVHRGQGDYAAWEEVRVLVEQRRKLIESHRKGLLDAKQMMLLKDVIQLMLYVGGLVRENVSNKDERLRISEGIRRVLSNGGISSIGDIG